MPKFSYIAIESASGKDKKGVIESASAEQAAHELKAMGLLPTAVNPAAAGGLRVGTKPAGKAGAASGEQTGFVPRAEAKAKKKGRPMSLGKVISNAGLAVFTRQLSTLVNAGMPILRSLETLARQEKNPGFKYVLEQVSETIKSGGTFSDGLLQHPKVFDRLYINMVKAGEAGGVLGTVLDRLAKFMEKAEKIKGKVKAAMIYPLIIAVVASLIVLLLMIFVIPKFQEIFDGLLKGVPLPLLTQIVIGVANFIKHNILISIGLLIAVFVGYKMISKTKKGKSAIDWFQINFSSKRRLVVSPAHWAPFYPPACLFCRRLSSPVIPRAMFMSRPRSTRSMIVSRKARASASPLSRPRFSRRWLPRWWKSARRRVPFPRCLLASPTPTTKKSTMPSPLSPRSSSLS